MPRARRKPEPVDDVELEEEEAPKRRGRRRQTEEEEAPPKRRGRRRQAEEPEEEAPPKRRGRRRQAEEPEEEAPRKKAGRAKQGFVYIQNASATGLWEELDDGKNTRVIAGDKNPSGNRQKQVMEELASRGRKKTTADQLIGYLIDEEDVSEPYATWVIANAINRGVLEVA